MVNPGGTLRLVTPGSSSGVGSSTYVASSPPGFSASNFYTLSYTVNTASGAISNVIFDGINDTSLFNTTASGFAAGGSSTLLAGFYGSTDVNTGNFGRVDNFSIVGIVPYTVASGNIFNLSASQQINALSDGGGTGGTVNLNGFVLTIGSGNADIVTASFSGLIADGSAGGKLILSKAANGAQTLTGANTYTGGTTINGGSLIVGNSSGSATGSGPVVVNSSGSLQVSSLTGVGAVGGLVTVAGGGAIRGSSGTSLGLSGGLTLQANSVSNFTLSPAGVNNSTPIVNVAGTFSVASQNLVNIAGSVVPGTYDLYGYMAGHGPTSAANFTLNTSPAIGYQWRVATNSMANQIDLIVVQPLQSTTAYIVQDDFSTTNSAANASNPIDATSASSGRSPDLANLAGSTYATYTINAATILAQPSIDTTVGNPAPSAATGFNGATYLNIASNGAYKLPKLITISADIQVNSIISQEGYRGVGLGVFSGMPINGESSTTFTGLTVTSGGNVDLVIPGATSGISTSYYAPALSGFNANNFYNLSYTVNTTTGAISNVFFNGINDSSYFNTSLPGFIAGGSTFLAGFYGSTDVSAQLFGRVDNFSIAQFSQSLVVPVGFTYGLSGNLQVVALSDGGGPGGTVNLNGSTLTVGAPGDSSTSTFSGVVASGSPAGGELILAKAAGGGLTLSGINTYTGTTLVTGGTLTVTGSLANNGSASVLLAVSPTAPATFAADTPIVQRAVRAGGSYAGFGSSIDTDLLTKADILAGTNTIGSGMVNMSWRQRANNEIYAGQGGGGTSPPLPDAAASLISDVLNLTGMGTTGSPTHTDPFVLEMTYDPALLISNPTKPGAIYLAWLDPTGGPGGVPIWQNAVLGDDMRGPNAVAGYLGSYAHFTGAGGPGNGDSLAQLLGSWGVDTANGDVWAIIDHNSQFAVVPEPSALTLIAIGGLSLAGLAVRRRMASTLQSRFQSATRLAATAD